MTSVVGWRRLVRHVINELTQGRNHVVNVGVQFLALGYCTEQNTDGIPSFVHCSLLPNGNHILIQKSWGGPPNFGGPDPPVPPVVAPLNWLQMFRSVEPAECGVAVVEGQLNMLTCDDDIVDLDHMRVVKCDRHDRYARDHGMTSYFVSAKTGESVSWHRSPCCCCCLKFNIVWPFRLAFTTGVLAASYTIYVWKLTT